MRLHNRLTLICLIFASLVHAKESDQEDLTPSEPLEIASFQTLPSGLIDGKISAITGSIVLQKTDLVAMGNCPIRIQRSYISPCLPAKYSDNKGEDAYRSFTKAPRHGGWRWLRHLRLNRNGPFVTLSEPNGFALRYQVRANGTAVLGRPGYGIHNAHGTLPNGQFDPRNIRIDLSRDDRVVVQNSSGITREYYQWKWASYLLRKERLPNGKILSYTYNDKGQCTSISSHDPLEEFTYAEIVIAPSRSSWQFNTNTGLQGEYSLDERHIQQTWSTGGRKHEGSASHSFFAKATSPHFVEEMISYTPRFMLKEYVGKQDIFRCRYKSSDRISLSEFQRPIGTGGTFETTHQLSYDPGVPGERGGSTRIKRTGGSYIEYFYNSSLLITEIAHHDDSGTLGRRELFEWDENQRLRSTQVTDRRSQTLVQTHYRYDSFGNPVEELTYGDLTGLGKQDQHAIRRTFSTDGFHLLLSQSEKNGPTIRYAHHPGTNLPIRKEVWDEDHLLTTTEWIYDRWLNLVEKQQHDGPEHTITRWKRRQNPPFVHMVDTTERLYVENGKEYLLERVELLYDAHGQVKRENHYDANNVFSFMIGRIFDDAGNLLEETNPLRQSTLYKYDIHGQPVEIRHPCQTLRSFHRYDAGGRLQETTGQAIKAGIEHTTRYRYDDQDRLVAELDYLGNETRYQWDPIADAPTQTILPPVEQPDGTFRPVVHVTHFDDFGRPIATIDARGFATHFSYNARNQPTKIVHPDGGSQTFVYNTRGQLTEETNEDGLTTRYTYDALGQVVHRSYLHENVEIACESCEYSGSYLIAETDKEGKRTLYAYDGAGRLVRKETCGRVVDYSYDAKGNLAHICRRSEVRSRTTCRYFDVLGRIVRELEKGDDGQIGSDFGYQYDMRGNRRTIEWGDELWENILYDPFDRPIKRTDPFGHTTTYSYVESNQLGCIETSPSGLTTTTTHDAYGRLASKEASGLLQRRFYDPNGNLTDLIEEHCEGKRHTHWDYRPRNRIASEVLGENQITSFNYSPGGKLTQKVLPNGDEICYKYTPLGHLTGLDAPDLKYRFERDLSGRLIKAEDLLTNQATYRHLDPFGNTIEEHLGNGLVVKKSYDQFNRPLEIVYPDESRATYTYDTIHLRSVQRGNNSHTFNQYDGRGHATSQTLINECGTLRKAFDAKGRLIEITAPHFKQTVHTFDSEGNPTRITDQGEKQSFAYDAFNQIHCGEYFFDPFYNPEGSTTNALDQVTKKGSSCCVFDACGRMVEKDDWSFTYDSLDRLTGASNGSLSVELAYDPLGRCLSKKVNGKLEEQYFYDGFLELGATNKSGTIKQLRVLGETPHNEIGSAVIVELDGKAFAPIHDMQGNVRTLLGDDDIEFSYEPFGLQTVQTASLNPWRFASKRFHPEFGLTFFGKRFYDPELCRWLSPDPAGILKARNLYAYCLNNPFVYVDPNGEFFFLIAIPLAIPTFAILAEAAVVAVTTAAVAWAGYEIYQAVDQNAQQRAFENQVLDYNLEQNTYHRNKTKKKQGTNRPPAKNAQEAIENGWQDVSHPEAAARGHHTVVKPTTGDAWEFDQGKPGETGHKSQDHWHSRNPNATRGSNRDLYLDSEGNPCGKGSEASHIYY